MAENCKDEVITLNETQSEPKHDELEEDVGRIQWPNKLQYILALLGYSVGLGNLWRFPYVCQRNGGGAFLVPYAIVTACLAIPLFYLEVCLGQFTRQGPIGVWGLCPLMSGVGYSMLICNMLVTPYYSMVLTWSFYYLYKSFSPVLPWTTCGNTWNTHKCVTVGEKYVYNHSIVNNVTTMCNISVENPSVSNPFSSGHTSMEEFWQYNALGISSGIDDIGSLQFHLTLCWFLACVTVFCCIMKGIRSLGKVVYVTAVLPYLLLAVLLVRSCMMPGAIDGIILYLTPDFTGLQYPQVWLEALVQLFFSVGPAWGPIIVMSSHNPPHNNMAQDSILVTVLGEMTSVFAGFVVFATVGFLARSQNLPVEDVLTSGPGIGFIAYPEAVSLLPVSQLWSVLFFLVLAMLGIDTVCAHAETAIGCLEDLLSRRFRTRHLPTILAAVFMTYTFLAGLVLTTNGGVYIFQLMDWYVAAFACFIISLLECVVVGWLYGIKRFSSDIELLTGTRLPVLYKLTSCIVIPVVMLVMIIVAGIAYEPPTYGNYKYPQYAAVIGWCIAMVSVVPIPAVLMIKLLSEQGSLYQRLAKATRPNHSWQLSRRRHGGNRDMHPSTFKENLLFVFSKE